MVVSDKVQQFFHSGSAIRKMFVEGLRLKKEFGEEAVADMSIGNPMFPPPKEYTQAIQRLAADAENLQHAYMPNAGYPYVCEAVAGYLRRKAYFPGIEQQHIIMTTGAAGAMNVVLKTITNEGDEVIVIKPFFVEYRFYVDNHGGKMILVESAKDFDLDLEAIKKAINPKTKAIIINSPNNPSGRIYSEQRLWQLGELLNKAEKEIGHAIYLLSDEPYRDMKFIDAPFASPASFHDNSFMCFSWSKAFSISGERIGYIAINPRLEADNWPMLIGSLSMCNRFLGFVNAPAFMQHVIAKSLDAHIDLSHYRDKRQRLYNALDEAGYSYPPNDGSFYIFPKTIGPEKEFVQIAKENLLLVVGGSDFGREGYFRIGFAASDQIIDLACEKLITVANKIRQG